jgi:VIT1/CCC1 family predicted Fe2+/Mn2+ transporter
MGPSPDPERERLLDPVDRISEVLFGLIMAVTIVGSLSVASAGSGEVRTVLAAALGCNLAWGLVDAVMYLVRTLTERSRKYALARRIVDADPVAGRDLLLRALPPEIVAVIGPDEAEAMRRRLGTLPLPTTPRLQRDDYLGAVGIFLLVVLATLPVVVPFMLFHDMTRAMNASRIVTVLMLFIAGAALGRHAAHAHPLRSGVFAALLGIALIGAVKALGG